MCDAANIAAPDVNDVVSSMGVRFSPFNDIAPIGQFAAGRSPGSRRCCRISRTPGAVDPIPGFQGRRKSRVEPRNTPTMQAAAFNFDNFWDGRARHDFNGGSVFGAADPQAHVFVEQRRGRPRPRRGRSSGSRASPPSRRARALSEFEMSFLGRQLAQDREEAAAGQR